MGRWLGFGIQDDQVRGKRQKADVSTFGDVAYISQVRIGYGASHAWRRPPWSKSFTCSNCEALYKVVKVEAGPETIFSEVTCRVCGAPVPNREDNSSSNTSCCEKRVVFKGGAPIEAPASFPLLAGAKLSRRFEFAFEVLPHHSGALPNLAPARSGNWRGFLSVRHL